MVTSIHLISPASINLLHSSEGASSIDVFPNLIEPSTSSINVSPPPAAPNEMHLIKVEFEAQNLTEEERKGYKEVTWDDKEVCGFYMVQALLSDKEEFEKDLKRLNDKLTSASLTIMLKVSC
ncbi:hypothetical protein Ahy_B05g076971 isoform L [Arachis hypogaea]|uniref:Uncharacterized protein n=1 Tax=Arachis hypogaea TaxID=3818 RepID=A0A444Z478_ARAHY|nr:hypothetical protein Ahy_B05g076971 isoform L [Arachis hypogaea]